MGYPAQIQSYSGVATQYTKTTRIKGAPGLLKFEEELSPTSMLLKELTRQYFERGRGNGEAANVLHSLEVWKEFRDDPQINRKIADFFRDNLRTNREIVGKEYSHLY
jgi:hypothetical protein